MCGVRGLNALNQDLYGNNNKWTWLKHITDYMIQSSPTIWLALVISDKLGFVPRKAIYGFAESLNQSSTVYIPNDIFEVNQILRKKEKPDFHTRFLTKKTSLTTKLTEQQFNLTLPIIIAKFDMSLIDMVKIIIVSKHWNSVYHFSVHIQGQISKTILRTKACTQLWITVAKLTFTLCFKVFMPLLTHIGAVCLFFLTQIRKHRCDSYKKRKPCIVSNISIVAMSVGLPVAVNNPVAASQVRFQQFRAI